MLDRPPVFGAELRRLRLAAGMTIEQLARSVHYSKAQISKVETGRKQPTTGLARLCDAALGADGELHGLLDDDAPPPAEAGRRGRGDAPSRRQLVAVGAASVLGVPGLARPASGRPASARHAEDGSLASASRALFDQYRQLGQVAPAQAVLPGLSAQTTALSELARASAATTARDLYALSSRFAEFTGWMAQEAGDIPSALRWTDTAVQLAQAAGDRDLRHYAQVRRGLVAYYAGQAADTIGLARSAESGALSPRVKGLAAQREAQGHALAGDHTACFRALERAGRHLAADAGTTGEPVIGTTNLPDPAAMVTAWCLLDLGRPGESARIFDRECARIPPQATRTQARYGTRRALAHAQAGEIDLVCSLLPSLLGPLASATSATVLLDARRLNRTLARYRGNPAVRELLPELAASLHGLPG
ncbi:helix-turn-helix domain-containing protein [Streptomyces physcomitrii]